VTSALQAVIFDFDGVIADSEPLHFRAFQQALAEDGLELTPKEYYARYLGYDDVGMFQAFAEDHGVPMDAARVSAGLAQGHQAQAMLTAVPVLFPGAVDSCGGGERRADRHRVGRAAPRNPEVIEAAASRICSRHRGLGDTPRSKPSPAPIAWRSSACRRPRAPPSIRGAASRSKTRAGARIRPGCRVTL
jgi:hypothetical protein